MKELMELSVASDERKELYNSNLREFSAAILVMQQK
jgi:hypothetical protein